MKLIIVRHGDPDYVKDGLTEKGKREAELLAEYMRNVKADKCYVSPLGRAQETAAACLKYMDVKAETFEWLREFAPRIHRPDRPDGLSICWDWMPEDWTADPLLYDFDKWTDHPVFKEANVRAEVDWVYENFEKLLNSLGYRKQGRLFLAEKPNNDTVVFFCHFGLEVVLMSYLLNVSPMILWHGFIAVPTAVTTIATEERREGKAFFRIQSFGETAHLKAGNEPASFSGRFCECFANADERH